MKSCSTVLRGTLRWLAIFGIACVVFAALAPQGFYKADGPRLVLHLLRENPVWPQHPLYLPIVIGFGRVLEALGIELPPFDVCRVAAHIGTAAGLAFADVGMQRLFAAGKAAWRSAAATVLVATCPAVVLFGSVVEIHGVFFGFAGLSFALLCLALPRLALPRTSSAAWSEVAFALLAGAVSAVATAVHASGLLLPAAFLPLFVSVVAKPVDGGHAARGRALAVALSFVAAHVGLVFVVADPFGASRFVEEGFGRPQGVEHLPRVVLDEYVLALMPLSVLGLAVGFQRTTRWLGVAAFLAALPYCAAALELLVAEPEFGAYLLPLALPLAYVCVRAYAAPILVLAAVVASVLGLATLRVFAPSAEDLRYRADLSTCIGEDRGMIFVGAVDELTNLLIAEPALDIVPLDEILVQAPEAVRATLPIFDAKLRDEWAKGRRTWLSGGARALLASDTDALPLRSRSVLAEHLDAQYEWRAVSRGSCELYELVPR